LVESSPAIIVHVPGPLREYCGGASRLQLAAGTVHDLLIEMERRHPALYCNVCDETGKVRRHLNVFVNSDHMRDLNGIDTGLRTGDVVTFLPAVSGG
jgi:molybdopterin converting factor small subunit